MTNAWHILGLDSGADERSVKRAYAALLKRTRPEDDAVAYQALREAYEEALTAARRMNDPGAVAETLAVPRSTEARPDEPAPVPAAPETLRSIRARMVDVEPLVTSPEPEAEQQSIDVGREPVPATFAIPHVNHAGLAAAELQAWLAQPGADARRSLRERLLGETLTDLRTREVFELMAARRCAETDCPATLRWALVNELGWAHDAAHLQRLDGDAIDSALARYRADLSMLALQPRRSSEPAIDLLLSDHVPPIVLRMMDARFVRQMRAALEEITWQHADALRFRLNANVVERWRRKMSRSSYTAQTFVYSFLAGLALTATLQALMWPDHTAFGTIAAFSYGVAMGGTALCLLLAPAALRTSAARLAQAVLARLMRNELYDKLLRGWSFVAGAATMLLFVDLPGMARSVTLLLCAAAGLLLLVPVVVRGLYALIGVQAGVVAIYLYMTAGGNHALLDLLTACLCLAVIKVTRIRWWADLCERLGARAALWPASWLAGCILIVGVARYALLPPSVLAPLAWMLMITGVLYVSSEMPFVGAAVVALALGLSMNFVHMPAPALWRSMALALEPLLLMLAARAMYACHRLITGRAAAA